MKAFILVIGYKFSGLEKNRSIWIEPRPHYLSLYKNLKVKKHL